MSNSGAGDSNPSSFLHSNETLDDMSNDLETTIEYEDNGGEDKRYTVTMDLDKEELDDFLQVLEVYSSLNDKKRKNLRHRLVTLANVFNNIRKKTKRSRNGDDDEVSNAKKKRFGEC